MGSVRRMHYNNCRHNRLPAGEGCPNHPLCEENLMHRRDFLRQSKTAGIGLAAGVTILPRAASVWGAPANERLSLAVVGMRNRGLALASGFAQRADCRIAYLCDADSSLKASRVDSIAKTQGGVAPVFVQDFRK